MIPAMPFHQRPAFWAAALILALGAVAALRIGDAIGPSAGYLLIVIAMSLMIPFVRTTMARQKSRGHLSPAIARYTRRFMIASFGYMLGLGLAVTIHERVALSTGGSALIALLPILPIVGMVWTMARYLFEETDEYLRHRAMMASLFGLGFVLTGGTFWGFLETFEVAPHVDAWWVFPVWAIGLGAAQCAMAQCDRRGSGIGGNA